MKWRAGCGVLLMVLPVYLGRLLQAWDAFVEWVKSLLGRKS